MTRSSKNSPTPIILQTGFRIFFLGAACHAVISVVFWLLFYVLGAPVFFSMPLMSWHGHEMIYGFTMAVVAGFLLTAVMNWTGLKTLTGTSLLVLFLFWALARVFALIPGELSLWFMGLLDNFFLGYLLIAVSYPVIKVKQWRQSAVLSKVMLIFICNLLFCFSLSFRAVTFLQMELKFSVYLIISLILTISRRILPFFVERGVGYPVQLRHSKLLDISSLVLLTLFAIGDVFFPQWKALPFITGTLVVVHSMRLKNWWTFGIVKKPLLWVLFIGYLFLIIGFLLQTLTYTAGLFSGYALHAFTYGGIGIMCLGMMARVAWGHTGRKIHEFPDAFQWIFIPLILGACVRVFLPLIYPSYYKLWMMGAQLLWILAFLLYFIVYFPILTRARPDGRWG